MSYIELFMAFLLKRPVYIHTLNREFAAVEVHVTCITVIAMTVVCYKLKVVLKIKKS